MDSINYSEDGAPIFSERDIKAITKEFIRSGMKVFKHLHDFFASAIVEVFEYEEGRNVLIFWYDPEHRAIEDIWTGNDPDRPDGKEELEAVDALWTDAINRHRGGAFKDVRVPLKFLPNN